MSKTQTELNRLYAAHWQSISDIRKANPELSPPLLVKVPEKYFSQRPKLMVIGQQTLGWCGQTIEELLTCYEHFNFGKDYHASPFWNVTRNIEKALGVEAFQIAWSNLNRCDFAGGRPQADLEERIFSSFPVLADEVGLLGPQVVVFFSGPYFDAHIRRSFHGCVFANVDKFSQNQLCRIEHNGLPHHSYRTYHPKYLRISGLEPRVVEAFGRLST